MLRIASFGPGHAAIVASVAFHAGAIGVAAGLSHPLEPRAGAPVEIEFSVVEPGLRPAPAAPAPAQLPERPNLGLPVGSDVSHGMRPPRAPRTVRASGVPAPPAPNAATSTLQSAPLRFSLPPAAVAVAASAIAIAPHAGSSADGGGSTTFPEAQVSRPARLLRAAPLAYPPRARSAEVEASVPLELIVDARGQVIEAHVLAPAGYGLEDAALAAVRAYRFTPAQRLGQPVQVRMRWSIQFRLRA